MNRALVVAALALAVLAAVATARQDPVWTCTIDAVHAFPRPVSPLEREALHRQCASTVVAGPPAPWVSP
jgi:hypothetical protein